MNPAIEVYLYMGDFELHREMFVNYTSRIRWDILVRLFQKEDINGTQNINPSQVSS